MQTLTISKIINWDGILTRKVKDLCLMFGLNTERITSKTLRLACSLRIREGDVVLITGPSGSGKSVLLREIEKTIPPDYRINLEHIRLRDDRTLIDSIEADMITSLRLLSTAGLNDVFCLLNKPSNLSEGQKYRFRLARAINMRRRYIFADEFCSAMDRLTAAVVSHKIRQYASRSATTFVLAASQDDFCIDLAPDVLIVLELSGEPKVIYKDKRRADDKAFVDQ